MRKIISIVMMVAAWMGVAAQSLSVTDFKPLPIWLALR